MDAEHALESYEELQLIAGGVDEGMVGVQGEHRPKSTSGRGGKSSGVGEGEDVERRE